MKAKRYQEDALLELMQARENGAKSALVVMAPSLGKTVVSAMDAQYFLDENPETRVLYLCHSNEVLAQAKKTFKKVFGDEYSYGFYNGLAKSKKTDFVFASFQTLALRKADFSPDEFSYIIVDEAHHAPAITFRGVVEYFEPKFLLGLTATPNRLDGLDLSEIFGETVYSMDLTESMVEGYVADVDYRLMLDEMQELDSVFVDGEKLSVAEINRRLFIPKRDEEIVRLIKQKAAERKDPRTMIFCRSVEHADNIANLIEGAEVVHSKIGEKECLRRIARFRKGQTKTIVSVDQLNEGVDIPQADVIVFLRSTVSPVVFYQQLGRGLRTHDGKEGVLILDFVGNCERLEMINDFYHEVKERQERFIEKTGKAEEGVKEHFILNIDTPKFSEQLVDILRRIDSMKIQRHFDSYSDEELILAIKKKAKELGKTPAKRDMKNPSCVVYSNRFGSWNKALEAAGLEGAQGFSTDSLISKLQQKATALGRTPNQYEMENPTRSAYYRVFGTWNNALKAAGLEMNREKQNEDDLISALQLKAKELGKVPGLKQMKNPSVRAYVRVFGSWNNALKAAGFEPGHKINYNKEELIFILQQRAEEFGRIPSSKEMKNPSAYPFRRVFGSWNKALEAAGLKS